MEHNDIVDEKCVVKQWIKKRIRNVRTMIFYLGEACIKIKSLNANTNKCNPIDFLEEEFKTNDEYDWKKLANFKAHIKEYSISSMMLPIILGLITLVATFIYKCIDLYVSVVNTFSPGDVGVQMTTFLEQIESNPATFVILGSVFFIVVIIIVAVAIYTYSKRKRMLSLIESIESKHKDD